MTVPRLKASPNQLTRKCLSGSDLSGALLLVD
jgi:hypothetical protein